MEIEDYPRTQAELERRFSNEQAWREYLFALRWPGVFCCPRCGMGKAWPLASGRWQCAGCGHQISVTAGTVFPFVCLLVLLSRRTGGAPGWARSRQVVS